MLALPFAVDVGDGEGPEGEQVGDGDEFGENGGKKFPVPAEKRDEHGGHDEIEDVVSRREGAFREHRKDDELKRVGRDREDKRSPEARAFREREWSVRVRHGGV